MNKVQRAVTSSWKTTLGGVFTSIGLPLVNSDEDWVRTLGQILVFVGPLLMGVGARDSDKTSEDSGAKR